MNEDDLTKNLPPEDAPTADPLSPPDTAPMLEQILAAVIATREMLMVQISMVRADLEKLSRKVDGCGWLRQAPH